QHLHLLSVSNLERLLREGGFEPVVVRRGEAHIPVDFFCAAMLMYSRIAHPHPDAPWLPRTRRSMFARARHLVVWTIGLPLIPLATLLDAGRAPIIGGLGIANGYGVVARRDLQPVQRPIAVDAAISADTAVHALT